MPLPSFDTRWIGNAPTKPRLLVLEVQDRLRQTDHPVGWVAVERVESAERDQGGTVFRASIVLHYSVIDQYSSFGQGGRFDASYCGVSNKLSLTSANVSGGAVFLDPGWLRGHRVGTYLMNEIVCWARQWPQATVNPVSLLEDQAGPRNKLRRNRFYEQFGLQFDYDDHAHSSGKSRAMPADALTPVSTWKENIVEHPVQALLAQLLDERRDIQLDVHGLQNVVREQSKSIDQAERSPWIWAARTWLSRHVQVIIVVGLGLMLAAGLLAHGRF
jgi:GNAT superfamily N-acetyltransferase